MAQADYVLSSTCGSDCPCGSKPIYTHLNVVRNQKKKNHSYTPVDKKSMPLEEIENPEVKWINVRGREEHEAVIKDAAWCKELGLDQIYETIKYLKRWGSWLTKD